MNATDRLLDQAKAKIGRLPCSGVYYSLSPKPLQQNHAQNYKEKACRDHRSTQIRALAPPRCHPLDPARLRRAPSHPSR